MDGHLTVTGRIPFRIKTPQASASSNPRRHERCSGNGIHCPNRPTSDVVGGVRVKSLFCEYHHCHMVESGTMCRVAKPPGNDRYCNQHLRCAAVEGGTRCTQRVKNNNPNRYNFCAEIHSCSAGDCPNQRSHLDGHPSPFCQDHRCRVNPCGEVKGDGPYCRTHTCEHDGCFSHVPGRDGQRLCERHQQCRVQPCARPCHIREGGTVAPFCSDHCCDAEDCGRERMTREGGCRFCFEHRCEERACARRRVAGQHLCKEHECKQGRCHLPRMDGSEYCALHRCIYRDCPNEAEANRLCPTHQGCSEPGCPNTRFTSNGATYLTCEDHYIGVCTVNDGQGACGKRIAPGARCCVDHLCLNRPCVEQRLREFLYCYGHKCHEPNCSRPRGDAAAAAAAGRRLLPPGPGDEHQFCERHTCAWDGCRGRTAPSSRFCTEHPICRYEGCGGRVDRSERDMMYCLRHPLGGRENQQRVYQQPREREAGGLVVSQQRDGEPQMREVWIQAGEREPRWMMEYFEKEREHNLKERGNLQAERNNQQRERNNQQRERDSHQREREYHGREREFWWEERREHRRAHHRGNHQGNRRGNRGRNHGGLGAPPRDGHNYRDDYPYYY